MGSSQSKQSETTGSNIPKFESASSENTHKISSAASPFPTPSGDEYDVVDTLAADLPQIIDDETQAQVDEYIRSCDNGKGPMVACYSMGEYLSLFERKHEEAMKLFENTCFREIHDNSPNGVEVDGTKAYPPSCFNLARFRMTGKGRTKFDRKEAFDLFDRGCRAGHDPSCLLQAKMLVSPPGSLGEGIPYDPHKAMSLFENICDNGDSIGCLTLGAMLLRGDKIDAHASNVTPEEARGVVPVQQRNGEDRRRKDDDKRVVIGRDPKRAERLLLKGCERGNAPSCFNLAVMYKNGDDGVDKDLDKAQKYKKRTEELVKMFGGLA